MLSPAPAAWLLVALCAAAGTYCVLRMRAAVGEQRRDAGGDALMGFGMAVMAIPAATVAPPAWSWQLCAGVFGALALRAAWSARRAGHHLHHLVGALAMVYMAGVMAWEDGRADDMSLMRHGSSGVPPLTGALLLYFAGHVLWSGTRLVPAPPTAAADPGAGAAPRRWADRPELARACRLSMSIGMLAMLLAL